MQSLSKYNKRIKYLLCGTDLFSKYAWVIPIKDKKGTTFVNTFQKKFQKATKQSPKDEENQIKYGWIKVVNFIIIISKIF